MKVYEAVAGESIAKTAERMITLANEQNGSINVNFNDIILTANPDDKPEKIEQFYETEWQLRREQYLKSQEAPHEKS